MGCREVKNSLPLSSLGRTYVRKVKVMQDSRYNAKEKHRTPNCTYTLIKVKYIYIFIYFRKTNQKKILLMIFGVRK